VTTKTREEDQPKKLNSQKDGGEEWGQVLNDLEGGEEEWKI